MKYQLSGLNGIFGDTYDTLEEAENALAHKWNTDTSYDSDYFYIVEIED